MNRAALRILLCFWFGLAGCGSRHESVPPPALIRIDPTAAINSWPLGLTTGRLILNGDCVQAQTADGTINLIFPASFSVANVGGRWRIADRNGDVWGTLGESLQIGGGPVASREQVDAFVPKMDRQRCPGDYWLVLPDDPMDLLPRNQGVRQQGR